MSVEGMEKTVKNTEILEKAAATFDPASALAKTMDKEVMKAFTIKDFPKPLPPVMAIEAKVAPYAPGEKVPLLIPDAAPSLGAPQYKEPFYISAGMDLPQVRLTLSQKVKTQKAKGLLRILGMGKHFIPGIIFSPGNHTYTPSYSAVYKPTNPVAFFPYQEPSILPAFARPCPMKPRHGFVESRVVSNPAEMAQVIVETLRADPQGEIIFMPKLTAKFSLVATNAGVSVGWGNDGVTAGKETFSLPSLVNVPIWNRAVNHGDAGGIEPGECVYLEGVEHKGLMRAVQLRGGPGQSGDAEFIPADVVVKVVHTPMTDLLEWQYKVVSMKKGAVVWSPGGSLSSHAAIHCILHNIPFLTRMEEPKVGDTIVAKKMLTEETLKAGKVELKKLAQALQREIYERPPAMKARNQGLEFLGCGETAGMAVGTAHGHAQWSWGEPFIRLRAFGLINMLRLMAVSAISEARHFYRAGPGRTERDLGENANEYTGSYNRPGEGREPVIPWDEIGTAQQAAYFNKKVKLARHSVYRRLWHAPFPRVMEWAVLAAQDLAMPGWIPSYGGKKWNEATVLSNLTWTLCQEFIADPTPKRWVKLAEYWNLLINSVHNSGRVLTKWLGNEEIDRIASAPTVGFLSELAVKKMLEYSDLPGGPKLPADIEPDDEDDSDNEPETFDEGE